MLPIKAKALGDIPLSRKSCILACTQEYLSCSDGNTGSKSSLLFWQSNLPVFCGR